MQSALSIDDHFVVMSPDKKATMEPCDSGLYARLGERYGGFAGHELVSCHSFDADWTSWEMHPHGDEVVLLLSGRVTFVLEVEGVESSAELNQQGQYIVVPQGVWHTARTAGPCKVLFLTPGQGTQHRGAD